MVRTRIKYKSIAFFTAVAAAIAVLSLVPELPQPNVSFHWMDKLEHLAAYGLFGASLFNALPEGKLKGRVITVLAVSLIFGGTIEVLQQFTGRSPEIFDLLADFIGAAAGVFIYIFIFKSAKT
ncbi:MAG: hypothetical protein DRP59_07730 [Spirochaetes bacterium]|nr:MAG: hypothetical protein DRP59_07730 [Spirochaetota bacterium]